MSFTYEFEGLEVETAEGEFFYCHGGVEFELVDNSFDYAGTHCTHGQDGTHNPGDSVEIGFIHIDDVLDEDGKSVECSDDTHGYLRRLIADQLEEDDTLIDSAHKQIESAKEAQAVDDYESREYDKRHGS